jgi:hypothetical protein
VLQFSKSQILYVKSIYTLIKKMYSDFRKVTASVLGGEGRKMTSKRQTRAMATDINWASVHPPGSALSSSVLFI